MCSYTHKFLQFCSYEQVEPGQRTYASLWIKTIGLGKVILLLEAGLLLGAGFVTGLRLEEGLLLEAR